MVSQKEKIYQESQAVGGYFVLRLLLNRQQMEPKWFYCGQERAVRF